MPKIELYHDNFQNFKGYGIPKAQLVIADIPYNLGKNAYASNPTPAERQGCGACAGIRGGGSGVR